MKRVLLFVLPLLVLAIVASGVIVGVALAQGGNGDDSQGNATVKQRFLDNLAQRLGVSADDFKGDIKGAANDTVNQLEQEGKLTSQQADRLRQRIENGDFDGFCGKGRMGELRAGLREIIQSVAGTLNLTPKQILSDIKDGKSLAEIAEAQNVSRDQLKSAITTSVDQQIDRAVTDGKLTQERGDQLKARLNDNIDRIIDWKRGASDSDFPSWGGMPQRRYEHGPVGMRFM